MLFSRDHPRREWLAFAALAGGLVLVRSFVAVYYESFFFDSDQAIVGLMARHLQSGRDFPLYYYGLNYLLGVQAWMIAPFFALMRPSVAVMRVPLLILNLAVAIALIRIFVRRVGLRPAIAFVAALPIVMPSPGAAAHLLEAAGASIEPFVYVIALWLLRRRPILFGALLGVAVLHREFVIFAIPALAITAALADSDLRRLGSNPRQLFECAAPLVGSCAIVWLAVDDLKLHLGGGSVALQAASLGGQLCFDATLSSRVSALFREALPALYGARPVPLQAWRMDSTFVAGHGWLVSPVGATMIFLAVRTVLNWRRLRNAGAEWGFGLYLMLIGSFAACAYPLSCNVASGRPPVLRYLLFALLIPIGLFVVHRVAEPSDKLRRAAVAALLFWTAVNFADNVRLIASTAQTPPLAEHRVLTDYLLSNRVAYASAAYWDAYVVSFLSRERVIVASNDLARIPEYQKDVEAHAADAVNLARQPCVGFATVASWCLQR